MKSIPIFSLRTIEKKITPLLNKGHEKPVLIHYENAPYVVKFERREKGRIWREWSSAIVCWLLFQVTVRPSLLHSGSIQHEASRLRKLGAKSLNVPKIYIEQPHYIVMEYCGESLEKRLKSNPNDSSLLYAIVESLIGLHQAGQWHGGAQVRNLTLKNDKIYRIDFEENTGNAMPLHLAQAYDVLLCFTSLSCFLKYDQTLGVNLLSYYLGKAPNTEMYHLLLRLDFYLITLRKLLPLLGKKAQRSNDVLDILYFSDILHTCLKAKKT